MSLSKEEITELRDRFSEACYSLGDAPDERIMQVYQDVPEFMEYVLTSKDVLEKIFRAHDLEPEF